MQAHNTFTSEADEQNKRPNEADSESRDQNTGVQPAADQVSIEFLSNLAHQLRSPLSSLRVWIDLLGDPAAIANPDDTKRLVDGIDRATSRLERQIKDVLEAGYLQAGTLNVDPVPIDVTEQIAQAVAEAEHAARSRRITIDLNFNGEKSIANADAERLLQVINCLFSNAIRFSPVDSTITVTTGSIARIAGDPATTTILEPGFEGDALYVCVSDTGAGIARSMHREIFEPFFRATRKDLHGGGGSGLGLAITHGLIKLHRGGLWLRSDAEKGSDFEFSLPQASIAAELN